jgi:hypothetical protein
MGPEEVGEPSAASVIWITLAGAANKYRSKMGWQKADFSAADRSMSSPARRVA